MPRRSKYHPIDLNVREGQEGYNMIAIHCPPPIGMKDMNQIEQKLVRTRPTAVSAAGGASNSHHTNSNSNSNGGSVVGEMLHTSPTTSSSSSTAPTLTVAQQAAAASKRTKMAMTVAMNPAQALGMNVLMLYMSGSQLNIFSIQTTSSAIMTPITNILSMEHIFGQFTTTASSTSTSSSTNEDDTTIPKLIFIAINLLWLCIGLYKMSSMRLLPTTSADYTYKVLWKQRMETTSIPPDNNFIF